MRLLVDGGWEARKGLRGKWFGFLEADVYDQCDSNTFEEAQHCRGEPVKIPPRGGSVTVSNAKLKSELRLPVVTDGGGALRKCAAQSAYIAVRTQCDPSCEGHALLSCGLRSSCQARSTPRTIRRPTTSVAWSQSTASCSSPLTTLSARHTASSSTATMSTSYAYPPSRSSTSASSTQRRVRAPQNHSQPYWAAVLEVGSSDSSLLLYPQVACVTQRRRAASRSPMRTAASEWAGRRRRARRPIARRCKSLTRRGALTSGRSHSIVCGVACALEVDAASPHLCLDTQSTVSSERRQLRALSSAQSTRC